MKNRIDLAEDAIRNILDEAQDALDALEACRDDAEEQARDAEADEGDEFDPDAVDEVAMELLDLEGSAERIASWARDLRKAVTPYSYGV